MKTFEDELYETLAYLVCEYNSGGPMPSRDALKPDIDRITAAHQAEMDRVVEEVIDAAKLTGDSRGEENIGLILSTISVIAKHQSARYKAIKEKTR